MRALMAAGLLAMTTACAPSGPVCTEIGSTPGISVTVQRDVAATVRQLSLRLCVDDVCREAEVELLPGSVSIPLGCSGTGPDAACSASASPDGTRVGFVDAPELVAGTARVSARATVQGKRTDYPAVDVPVTTVYPNGPDCDGQSVQGRVVLDRSGLHAG